MLTSALSANIRLGWKGLPGQTLELITNFRKLRPQKVYNIDTGTNVIKLKNFYGRNLRVFIIS